MAVNQQTFRVPNSGIEHPWDQSGELAYERGRTRMLLTSTYNPNAAADVPVIIVCYRDRKAFMLKANTYSKMVSKTRQKFHIEATRQLYIATVALDVCRGSNIEVGEDVWSVLMPSLDEIIVVVSDEDLDDDPPKRALDMHEGGAYIEDDERVKEEYVEDWLEQQNEVDDVLPPPSVYSDEIEYEDERQRAQDHNEYLADDFHSFKEESAARGRSPRVAFDAKEQELNRDEVHVDKPQRPNSSADERFQVSISGPQDQTAEIKTRGKHLVRKVLAAVCKTFDLDYDRCSLYVVTYGINPSNNRVEENLRMCPPDWSIASCGITSMTELRIQLESHSSSETAASHATRRSG